MILPVFPLLMIATTIGSVILYLRTANDIFSVLAVTFAIACLVWGLVVAHWAIHLLFLTGLVFFRPLAIARATASFK